MLMLARSTQLQLMIQTESSKIEQIVRPLENLSL